MSTARVGRSFLHGPSASILMDCGWGIERASAHVSRLQHADRFLPPGTFPLAESDLPCIVIFSCVRGMGIAAGRQPFPEMRGVVGRGFARRGVTLLKKTGIRDRYRAGHQKRSDRPARHRHHDEQERRGEGELHRGGQQPGFASGASPASADQEVRGMAQLKSVSVRER